MASPSVVPDWTSLVAGIRAGDEAAISELYRNLKGLRWYMYRQIGDIAEDEYHGIMADLVAQIQRGDLRNPEALAGYARTMAHHRIAARIQAIRRAREQDINVEFVPLRDHAPNPEEAVIHRERLEIAKRILEALPERDRAVLIRFYLDGEPAPEIQKDLELTETQFRLIKSRAKSRFAELCQARLAFRPGRIHPVTRQPRLSAA